MAGRLSALLITPPEENPETTLAIAGRALQGGINGILVRRPHDSARKVFELVRQLRPATRRMGCVLLVSDRIDVALAADADGAHLGARSLPVSAARRILTNGMLLGRSVHNLDEAGQAEQAGVDYLLLGPVFSSASHAGQPPLGLEAYREAVLRGRVPVLGVGGIDGENVRLIAQAGGPGAAAISAFYATEDAAAQARAFRAAFGR